MHKTILITGSSGFIGSKLAERFSHDGYTVYGIGRRPLIQEHYIQHDLAKPLSLDINPDVVIHAAALSSPWGSRTDFEQGNILATKHVLDFCSAKATPKLIYISSSSIYYKHTHQFNITEDTPLPEKAINLYAETKRRAEANIKTYQGEWAILRPRAVFGPGDTVVFPRIVKAARTGRLPLLTTKGEAVIGDLIYIDNLVDYIVQASTLDISGVYNLTNAKPIAILDFLIDIFEQLELPAPRRKVPVERAMMVAGILEGFHRIFMPKREPAITRFGVSVFAYSKTFDVRKMLGTFGEPKISVEEGKRRFVDWVKESQAY